MKRPVIETFLSKLDDSLRWTGIPAMVAAQMSDDPSVNRKQRPLRWVPLWPIAFSCGLFIGQPILMILSRWQHWDFPHIVSVGVSALMLNATLFGSLPTLYASWSLRRLPNE